MRDYQAVLSNAAVNAWFLMELTKCGQNFIYQQIAISIRQQLPKGPAKLL
jgi:hypothetical protein